MINIVCKYALNVNINNLAIKHYGNILNIIFYILFSNFYLKRVKMYRWLLFLNTILAQECFDHTGRYVGKVNSTRTGVPCMRWDADSPPELPLTEMLTTRQDGLFMER